MEKESSYQKRKAELKVKDQTIESLKRELDAKNRELDAANWANESKDQIIESKDQTIDETLKANNQTIESQKETIGALKREADTNKALQLIKYSTEERHRDEEQEYSKSCLGFE